MTTQSTPYDAAFSVDDARRGFYWHVHHDRLVEWCTNYEGRQKYIKRAKPLEEQPLRLRLLQPVRGKLPTAFAEAGTAYETARTASDTTWATYREAVTAYENAMAAYEAARVASLPEIEALHRLECPNCPWDGKTIFPSEEAQQ